MIVRDILTTLRRAALLVLVTTATSEATKKRLPENAASIRWTSSTTQMTDTVMTQEEKHGVSHACRAGLLDFLVLDDETVTSDADEVMRRTMALSVVTESSSHPTGLLSLYAQPWLYAGGGLGNVDECLGISNRKDQEGAFQTCLAGTGETQSLLFAAVCMVPSCTAFDLTAHDFRSVLDDILLHAQQPSLIEEPLLLAQKQQHQELALEYVTLIRRSLTINDFLQTGWTCGEYQVPWTFSAVIFSAGLAAWIVGIIGLSALANRDSPKTNGSTNRSWLQQKQIQPLAGTATTAIRRSSSHTTSNTHHGQPEVLAEKRYTQEEKMGRRYCSSDRFRGTFLTSLLSALDVSLHWKRLTTSSQESSRRETACLDGLRVGSICWIMLGHVMAIVSSHGGGYSNPADFLPPSGVTTTVLGQLLFGSRLAVDTFLIISGFLVVYVLNRKMPLSNRATSSGQGNAVVRVCYRYVTNLPTLLLARVVRIMPLYATTLGFYMFTAPHLDKGPFWYQWRALLDPCQEDSNWKLNLLFVNNFWPWDKPTSSTCFYHSWYLAVDMQLFCFAPLLVFLYQSNPTLGRASTAALLFISVFTTVYLAYANRWSINTFDGAAVALYDVQAYAKPHVRAQSYLAGLFLAMTLLKHPQQPIPTGTISAEEENYHEEQKGTPSRSLPSLRKAEAWSLKHGILLILSLIAMTLVTFGTATGAYARRPCQNHEWPELNQCGSTWSSSATFWWTALSRTAWILSVSTLVFLCMGVTSDCSSSGTGGLLSGLRGWISALLSAKIWNVPAQLSYGVYLIHPIIIVTWQLGNRQKLVFNWTTFCMHYVATAVVSYAAAAAAAVLVEFPVSALFRLWWEKKPAANTNEGSGNVIGFVQPSTMEHASGNDEELVPLSSLPTPEESSDEMSLPVDSQGVGLADDGINHKSNDVDHHGGREASGYGAVHPC